MFAYLTIGQGALAQGVYRSLRKHPGFAGVVFSRKKNTSRRWDRIKEYGLWFTAQYLIQQLLGTLRSASVTPEKVREDGADYRIWRSACDREEILRWLQSRQVTHLFVCGFQFILPSRFLDEFQHCFNVHPSLLPDYRGPEPIAWGLLEQQRSFGWTLHLMDAELDTGQIVAQRRVSRPFLPLISRVEAKLANTVDEVLSQCLADIEQAVAHSAPQASGFYLPAATLANRKQRKKQLL